jgi:sporulation protein YlmC with PRC-barrel domain
MPTASGHTTAIAASRVIGAMVLTKSGEEFGKVGDVILDKTADRILFAVVARSGALTVTDNFYPVPWSMLDYDDEREAYVMPCAAEDFVNAPSAPNPFDLTVDDGQRALEAVSQHFKAG